MKIAVVGLGLIGGSFCRAIKKYTDYSCAGLDCNLEVIKAALNDNVIDEGMEPEALCDKDLVIICLYPDETVSFIKEHAELFKEGSIVIDVCGVKEAITENIPGVLEKRGVTFIGTHPMAGREFSGYENSQADLFKNASFIITPFSNTQAEKVRVIESFACQIGFCDIVVTTPQLHDRIIAFTSQLAHVVSNAYVKSPTLKDKNGFSAGSFGDLSRVAQLNEKMWSSLFLLNRDNLLYEIENIIEQLGKYKKAIEEEDEKELQRLLKEGSDLKKKA